MRRRGARQAHDDRNLARMLTPAERKEKKTRKLVGAAAEGEACPVTCYRIASLANTQHRFKVRVNAVVRRPARCVLAQQNPSSFRPAHCAASRPRWSPSGGGLRPVRGRGLAHLAGSSLRGCGAKGCPTSWRVLGASEAAPSPAACCAVAARAANADGFEWGHAECHLSALAGAAADRRRGGRVPSSPLAGSRAWQTLQWLRTAVAGAQELHLTGIAVASDGMAVVVAEGGAKAQKKYAKLLLHRIAWAAGREDDADAAGAPGIPPGPRRCALPCCGRPLWIHQVGWSYCLAFGAVPGTASP